MTTVKEICRAIGVGLGCSSAMDVDKNLCPDKCMDLHCVVRREYWEAEKECLKPVGKCPDCGGDVYSSPGTMGNIPIIITSCASCRTLVNGSELEANDE